jgi:hypothetical protein
MIEAVTSSETSVNVYETTRHNILGDRQPSSFSIYVRFDVLAPVKMLTLFFWVRTPFGLEDRDQRFEETYCLHRQG